MENRRKFARIELDFPVNIIDVSKAKKEFGLGSDVSAKGLGITLKKKPEIDSIIELQLHLPDGGKPLIAYGKVIWIKQLGGNAYRLGITVENLNPATLSRSLKLKLE